MGGSAGRAARPARGYKRREPCRAVGRRSPSSRHSSGPNVSCQEQTAFSHSPDKVKKQFLLKNSSVAKSGFSVVPHPNLAPE